MNSNIIFLLNKIPQTVLIFTSIVIVNGQIDTFQPNPFSINSEDYDTGSPIVFPEDSYSNSFSQNYNLRKSELKCKEYSNTFTSSVQAISLMIGSEPTNSQVSKCNHEIPLIVGGEEAKLGDFPHMAALGYAEEDRINWRCGGALISEQYVLTAAHCSGGRQGPIIRVRLGELDLNSQNDGAEVQEFGVSDIIIHPEYRPPRKYNDIALVRLSRPAKLSVFVNPACLWTKDNINKNNATATGWGAIEFGGIQSSKLLKVSLPLIANRLCSKYYHNDRRQLPIGITDTMLCTSEQNGGKDTCQGDSGGPLQIGHAEYLCMHNLIGVTSFGKTCAANNTAGVYTKVSAYVDWIESIVWS